MGSVIHELFWFGPSLELGILHITQDFCSNLKYWNSRAESRFTLNQTAIMLSKFSFYSFAECCREATILSKELDSHVCDQLPHSCVGFGNRVRVRWMGQHDQLREASGHIWAVCKVLSMQASNASSSTSPTSLRVPSPSKAWRWFSAIKSSSRSGSSSYFVPYMGK